MGHEDLRREEPVERSSDGMFGALFGCAAALLAFAPLAHRGHVRWWAVGLSVALLAVAWLRPSLLAWPNRAWSKLADLLGKVVSPLALGIVFYLVFTPMGLVMRVLRSDPLRLRSNRAADSHWIVREPPGPPPGSMINPF